MANKKLHGWQDKACCKQEDTWVAKQDIWQTRSYTVGKIKHVVNKKLQVWQDKSCCKQEDTRLAKQNIWQTRS
jgi:hypothetical protein